MTFYDIDAVSIPIDQVAVPPAPPAIDQESQVVVAEAVTSLTLLRFPLSLGDATAELHVLASIVAQVEARIPDAVADARDQDHRWDDISVCLGISAAAVRRRFAAHARTRTGPPLED
jgi:hypothetical protein